MALSTPLKNFSKYSGAGNDFILIDDRDLSFPTENKLFTQRLCHRNLGIGADGIILVQPSEHSDFRFRIFNADGSEAEMCGNGVRCFAKFLQELGYQKKSFTLQTMERVLFVEMVGDEVAVEMGTPKDLHLNLAPNLHHIDTGVPHAVLIVADLSAIDIQKEGPPIRFHPLFQPKGANANFVQIHESSISLRTYERGVEGETLACGTGATAAALIASQITALKSPIRVHTKSTDILAISFDEALQNVRMQGPAHKIFHGTLE